MNNGKLYFNGVLSTEIEELSWNEHPKFKGVFMKNILNGNQTDQKLSTHLVNIMPNCEIGDHIHDGKSELHEIIEGEGIALVNNIQVKYDKGTVSYIPDNVSHQIKAGEAGLLLLAKFTPALS